MTILRRIMIIDLLIDIDIPHVNRLFAINKNRFPYQAKHDNINKK